MENLDIVLGLIVTLQKEDLAEVSKLVDSLLQKNPSMQEKSNDGNLELFYKIVQEDLKQNVPPLSILKKKSLKLFTAVEDACMFLDQYLDSDVGKGKVLVRTKRVIFYRLYIELLRAWFCEVNIPMSLSSVLYNHKKFPALLNRQFPGYVAAGLMLDVVDRTAHGAISHR